jgi:hypothetical protein
MFDLIGAEIAHSKESRYRNFLREILPTMTASEIMEIVTEKSSLVEKLNGFESAIHPIGDSLDKFHKAWNATDSINGLESLIKKLKLELRLRKDTVE